MLSLQYELTQHCLMNSYLCNLYSVFSDLVNLFFNIYVVVQQQEKLSKLMSSITEFL